MAMKFQPKSETQLTEDRLAKDGDYDFQVLEASDKKSKAGNQMIELKLGIFNGDALRWHVYDYLVPQMEVKLRHFCDCTGLLAVYESGALAAEACRGRAGRCRLIIEEAEGSYPDKNVVKDYILRKAKPLSPPPVQAPPAPGEDDVPF
jgi:hypothetical protein